MGRHTKKPLLPFLVLCCLVLPLASSVPMSRSQRLMGNQQHPLSLKLTSQDMTMMTAAARNLGGGRASARMVVEVNDYPGSGPNHRHDPPPTGPAGRA